MRIVACLPLALALAACTTVSSENIKTKGLSAQVEALTSASGGDASLKVTFRSGANYVQLTGNDSVRCENKGMTLTSILGVSTYSTSVPRKAAGEPYTCVVFRGDESITLASPQVSSLVLQGTVPATWDKAQATLDLKATPPKSGETQTATLDGTCLSSSSGKGSVAADGSISFSRSGLVFNSLKDGESCKVKLTVSNLASSNPPTSFEKATVTSSDSRTADLEILR
jgi:hypothetical protein